MNKIGGADLDIFAQQIIAQSENLNLEKLLRYYPDLHQKISGLEKVQKHKYKCVKLAANALIHRSALVHWPKERSGVFSNERLEFLGDSLVNFSLGMSVMANGPNLQEGELSRARAALVGAKSLASKATACGLDALLILGKGEQLALPTNRLNIMADAFEAITAALWLDAGAAIATRWLIDLFEEEIQINHCELTQFDVKSSLQQWIQGRFSVAPEYKTINETEETGNKDFPFTMGCFLNGVEIKRGSGQSKKEISLNLAQSIYEDIVSQKITETYLKELCFSKS